MTQAAHGSDREPSWRDTRVYVFAAKALPENLTEQVMYYVLRNGLIQPMHRMLDQCSTVEVVTNAAVSGVSRGGGRPFGVHCADGQSFAVDPAESREYQST